MKDIINSRVKFREEFRPFAPAIIKEELNNWFELDKLSPYMLLVSQLKKNKLLANKYPKKITDIVNKKIENFKLE